MFVWSGIRKKWYRAEFNITQLIMCLAVAWAWPGLLTLLTWNPLNNPRRVDTHHGEYRRLPPHGRRFHRFCPNDRTPTTSFFNVRRGCRRQRPQKENHASKTHLLTYLLMCLLSYWYLLTTRRRCFRLARAPNYSLPAKDRAEVRSKDKGVSLAFLESLFVVYWYQ